MLVTLIRDVYSASEAPQVRTAIDDLASPVDTYGFASNGVYVFFDPTNFEPLYVGLARDLSERFAQHNALQPMNPRGCKIDQIHEWFRDHDELGVGLFLQSPMAQAGVHRQRGTGSEAFYDEESATFVTYDSDGLSQIAAVEGQFLAAYAKSRGHLPPWNKIHGNRTSRNVPTTNSYATLGLMTGASDSLLVARRSIRGLSEDATAAEFESCLHIARLHAGMRAYGLGLDSPQILDAYQLLMSLPAYSQSGLADAWARMEVAGYLYEAPPPPAQANAPGRLLPGTASRQTPLPNSPTAQVRDQRAHRQDADAD